MKKTIKATPKKNIIKGKKADKTSKRKASVKMFADEFYRQYGDVMSRLAHE